MKKDSTTLERITMKTKTLMAIVMATILVAPMVHSGELVSKKDEFTGKVNKAFVSTSEETLKNGALYAILQYDARAGTVGMGFQLVSGVTDCTNGELLLKDSDGAIHKLLAVNTGIDKCVAVDVDAEWVKKPFEVRIPLSGYDNLDIEVDTTNLDLSKL